MLHYFYKIDYKFINLKELSKVISIVSNYVCVVYHVLGLVGN